MNAMKAPVSKWEARWGLEVSPFVTGRKLLQAAGDNALKPLMLECGGKSPELVFEDIRELGIEAVASAVVMGCMQNQGQLCVARSRLLVEQSLYPEMKVRRVLMRNQ